MIIDTLERELIYLGYYLSVQIRFIVPYWALGILIGSTVSVFGKQRFNSLFVRLENSTPGRFGIIPASILGILSPICLYGTIPIIRSFSQKGMPKDWLAAFMVSSILLNPQLLIYTLALGYRMFLLRLIFCLLAGISAGALVRMFVKSDIFDTGTGSGQRRNKDIHPNILIRLLKNMGRNIRATGPYFLVGILLTAIFQRYIPEDFIVKMFNSQKDYGVLLAATLGVPLYVCGGGTIPILSELIYKGMSSGGAIAFMLSGPATKFTNMTALKMLFTNKNFFLFLGFIFLFAVIAGLLVNFVVI